MKWDLNDCCSPLAFELNAGVQAVANPPSAVIPVVEQEYGIGLSEGYAECPQVSFARLAGQDTLFHSSFLQFGKSCIQSIHPKLISITGPKPSDRRRCDRKAALMAA